MSIRDNIVFGQYFDQDRYFKVLDCCCLTPDLKMFPTATRLRSVRMVFLFLAVKRRGLR